MAHFFLTDNKHKNFFMIQHCKNLIFLADRTSCRAYATVSVCLSSVCKYVCKYSMYCG